MSPSADRNSRSADDLPVLLGSAVVLVLIGVLCLAWFAAWWADSSTLANPFAYGPELLAGKASWPTGATWRFVVMLLLGLVLVVLSVLGLRYLFQGGSRIDHKAASMARAADLREVEAPAVRTAAKRLNVAGRGFGLPLGVAVRTGRRLYAVAEWTQVWIMGPRAGKTTSMCIPQLLALDGPAVATSNKVDLVEATRGPRSELGRTWVHDPQEIMHEPPSWWWNPLSFVTDLTQADKLVDLFVAATRPDGAKSDAYFEPAGRAAFAAALYAAALDDRPITDVYWWLADPDDAAPITVLRQHGQEIAARSYEAAATLNDRQRDGIFGTALQMTAFLRNESTLPWIMRRNIFDVRPEFNPHEFVRTTQTMYLISKEGVGSARAITAALTVAIAEAAEQYAETQPGGRLSRPLNMVLDEAANVVRWPDLPALYSHYGSRGILISTYIQSWTQGVNAWGQDGMETIWSAANVRGVGRGLANSTFLHTVSDLIGHHEVMTRSRSRSQGGSSISTQTRSDPILTVADLTAIPAGRAILFVSGMPATVLRLVPWTKNRDIKDRVAASIEYYGARRLDATNPATTPKQAA